MDTAEYNFARSRLLFIMQHRAWRQDRLVTA
jgi:hypothetical protein